MLSAEFLDLLDEQLRRLVAKCAPRKAGPPGGGARD